MRFYAPFSIPGLACLAAAFTLAPAAVASVSVTPASGGEALSADTSASASSPAWNSLGQIVIAEPGNGRGDIGGGTLILKAPTGFEFNMAVTPNIGFVSGNITSASIVVSDSTTLTITLGVSGSDSKDTLTIGDTTPVQVRPVAGTPLASGDIYRPTTGGGTAVIAGLTATANPSGAGGTSFGALNEVVGMASKLALQTAPPATATAGVAFSPQPVVLVQDQFGTTRNASNGGADDTTEVTAARGAGLGSLQGTTNVTSANGVATFANLWHNKAETITVSFSSSGLTGVTSGSIVVNPAPLTVRPNDLARSYGTTNPPLTVSYTGFIPGDTLETSGITGSPVLNTAAQASSPPGTYSITASVGTLAAQNYTFIFANGTLTVSKAPLRVAANDVMRLYGAQNPALTVTYTGFVLGQDSSVLSGSLGITTTAGPSSPIGAYPIVVSPGSLTSPNYAFTFVNGTLNVVAAGTLFVDSFSRGEDPGLLAPWLMQAGNWSVTGGILMSGTNALNSYGYVYLTNVWTDYSAQARIRFSTNSFGGGLASRLNPATGGRYAAWIYPEGSTGGSSMLKLLRFQNWTDFTVMQEANLPGVGTNWHTLKLVARGNRVAADYDGTLVASGTDTNAEPFLSGGISLEMWTDATNYTMSVDDVLVALPSGVAASNDTYSVRQALTLSIPAPGVLGNDMPEMGDLTASLAAGPAHGTLNLSTNGGFTYTPVASYIGTDSFSYRAREASSTSAVATVTISVSADRAPVATGDSYTLMANTTLAVPAPGVLTNDTDADGDTLTAIQVSGPTHGTLSLSPDGSFAYAPFANYVGSDAFTYRASDGLSNSSLATVSLSVTVFSPLYTDTFTRTGLSPWVVEAGNWALSGGVLQGIVGDPLSYGYAYLTNQWGNYSVQARLQFPPGGYGGGLAGRLNPATGARYAAWVYPEGSPGGSSLLKLFKFQNWTNFTVLQQVNLAGVGTNWHTLKLVMHDNRIAVHYDGFLVLSLVDTGTPVLASGGVGLELWTDTTPWTLSADDVTVSAVRNVLATNDSYSVPMDGTLVVPPGGVLANDFSDVGGVTAVLVNPPVHGFFSLWSNGSFAYVPAMGYSGPDSFTYRADDGLPSSSLATVALSVVAPGVLFTDDFTRTNTPGDLSPWVVQAGNWAVNGGLLQGGTNSPNSYGYAYLMNNWTNYEVQADIQLPAGAYGGGLAGRLNPSTGARYAAWIYPEGSAGGSNEWKLLRFQGWDSFTVMQEGTLSGVGTTWHSLKLAFQGSRIDLYFDGAQLTSVADPQPYLSGGVGLELWTDAAAYVLSADNVQVTALPPDLSVSAIGIVPGVSNQTMNVTFQGAPNQLYIVQTATNLVAPSSWVPVSTNLAAGNGRWTFTDPVANWPRRFYRAVRP